jgi:hypothetical protein
MDSSRKRPPITVDRQGSPLGRIAGQDRGAGLPDPETMGRTEELFQAVHEGKLDRFRALLAEDPALARARDERGVSVLLQARYRGRFDMIEALLALRAGDLDLFEAAALGDTDRLARLVAQEPMSLNRHSPDGFTPLHIATFFAQPEATRLLLQRGADVEAVSTNPMALRPIHSAAAGGSSEIVAKLLSQRADPNSRQHGGWTALHAAAASGRIDMVRALVQHGADVQAANDEGKTAYDLAVAKNHAAVVQLLRGGTGAR